MCYGSETGAADRIDEHTFLFQGCNKRGGREARIADIENHDVGINMLRVDLDPRNLLELSGQTFGVVVVLLQSPDIVLEGIDSCSSQNPGLSHRSPVHPAEAFGFVDQFKVVAQEQ